MSQAQEISNTHEFVIADERTVQFVEAWVLYLVYQGIKTAIGGYREPLADEGYEVVPFNSRMAGLAKYGVSEMEAKASIIDMQMECFKHSWEHLVS